MNNQDKNYTPKTLSNNIEYLAATGTSIDPIAAAVFQGLNKITDLASRSVVTFFQNQFSKPLDYDSGSLDMIHGYLAVVNGEEADSTKQPLGQINPISQEEEQDKGESHDEEMTQIIDGDTLVFKSHKPGTKGTKGSIVYDIEGTTAYYKDASASELAPDSGNVYGSICIEWDKPGGKGDTTYSATYTSLDTQNSNVGAFIRLTSQVVGNSTQNDITTNPSAYDANSGTIVTNIPNAGGHDNNLIIEIIPVSIDYLKTL